MVIVSLETIGQWGISPMTIEMSTILSIHHKKYQIFVNYNIGGLIHEKCPDIHKKDSKTFFYFLKKMCAERTLLRSEWHHSMKNKFSFHSIKTKKQKKKTKSRIQFKSIESKI